MSKYPKDLASLVQYFKKLPGVGKKTAERFAFQILSWQKEDVKRFSTIIGRIHESVVPCSQCGCFLEDNRCHFCEGQGRKPHVMCVVSSPKDIYTFEEAKTFDGIYHVLGGLLSPIDGIAPETLRIQSLQKRLEKFPVQEMILAFDSTIEGDATALYLKKLFQDQPIRISRLALGLPMGSSLDYIDGGTLMRAFSGRQTF